ncbi:hypothetical protein BDZ91DRAFT_138819 [Kalaharituber pfeilii]|nr:hypothetical protein BDZ91DRAFT_138819 [Kalaharituber pfeilii]
MDAGGLMAYNSYNQRVQPTQSTLGVPNSGFGSRGKNSHIRNISVPVPNPQDQPSVTTPRTGRAQLLAGLRTQPKTPTTTQATGTFSTEISNGLESSKYAPMPRSAAFAPKTARGLGFSASQPMNQYSPALPTPPQSSPAITMNGELLYDQQNFADAQAYADMLATTNYILAQRQQQLQQLLLAQQAQQLQQQLAGLQLQSPMANQFSTPPLSPGMGMFTPAAQNIPGSAGGLYSIQNPLMNYYLQAQQQQQQVQQLNPAYQQPPVTQQRSASPPAQQQYQQPQQQTQQIQASTASASTASASTASASTASASMNSSRLASRSRSPPKLTCTPREPQPGLSSSSFRKGHKKASSLSSCINANNVEIEEAPKTSVPKLSMLPATPSTATFAPGHASGTHPIRQPRGPPSFEEIKAKPTTKHEGSKNFATRQRRKAVFRLITAGLERRGNRATSGGTMTPVSENDGGFTFEDGDSVTSSLSGRQSLQSLREGPDSPPGYSASSLSGDEGILGGKLVEIKESSGGLRTPHLVLDAAEKRRSALF